MKRGKDDEKVMGMGPMFPRLNVNDAEKGGPRAPPRNKMALYEQLSIPSQRFRPPASSSQGNEHERGRFFPVQTPHSRNPGEKPPKRNLDPNVPSAQSRQQENSGDDDLTVPIFVRSEVGGQDRGKYHNRMNRENPSPSSPSHLMKLQSARQNAKSQNTAFSYPQTLDEAGGPLKQAAMSFPREPRDDPSKNFSRLQKPDSQPSGRRNQENSSLSLRNSRFRERRNLDAESHEDDVSETSMVDSVCEMDISPDDVVGIIGQKHFWKARKAIVNQQRVFAVQVFELHRLMKVQRLIAESPHLLLEDNAFLGKPKLPSSVKKLPLPLEYNVKAPSNVSKHKPEEPNNKMECSAENTVGKVSLSSVQNVSPPLAENTTPVASDPNMGAWGFHQPPQGHQWLVPVMSPSEGLVYKPYPGPGFPGPVPGGCGPPGMGNFFNQQYQGMGVSMFTPPAGPHGYFPPYGMPVMNPAMSGEEPSQFTTAGFQCQLSGAGANFSIQHQNSSNIPGQKSEASRDALSVQYPGQKSGASKDALDVQHQNSSNLPIQKSGANRDPLKLNVRNHSELQQVSTASSLSLTERGRDGMGRSNELPLFPRSPVTEVPTSNQTPQVIRVVPRNGRSATEFAARIFRSIQEERQQYDSV